MNALHLLFLVAGTAALALSTRAHAEKDYYRYKLEEGAEHEVCRHMTKVFNARFRTPWEMAWPKWEPNPKIYGTPPDKVFERLPGIEYKKEFVFDMLLSKYPSSPEFEAVKWLESREYIEWYDSAKQEKIDLPFPILIARLDVDNDGQEDWLVKSGFMRTPSRGDNLYGVHMTEGIAIYDRDAFNPTVRMSEKNKAQWDVPRRVIWLEDLHQLRPFVHRRAAYVAAYQAFWDDRPNRPMTKDSNSPIQHYPDAEYMNIVRILPGEGEEISPYVKYLKARTETICRIRMNLLKKPGKQGGR